MGIISTWIEKSRKIKSRGIALTHRDQGYSANQRHVSLLTKSDVDPDKLTVDIVKALEQVQLKISMEQFLRRFFDMWSSDAELLTKVLGFKTEFEQATEDNPPEGEWEKQWNEQHQEYLDERLSSITIIKKAQSGEELSLLERFQLVETRKAFEDGCLELDLEFNEDTVSKPEVEVKPETTTTIVVKGKTATKPTESSPGAPTTTIEETPVEKEVDVTKSQQFIDLMKANENLVAQMKNMEGTLTAAQEIVKAQRAVQRKVAVEKAASFTFVAAEQYDVVADEIEKAADTAANPQSATLVAILEKASEELLAKDAALVAKDAEIEEIKKSFGNGKDIGANGTLTDVAKGAEDPQDRLNRLIAERTKSTN